jgi:hypothetical protein
VKFVDINGVEKQERKLPEKKKQDTNRRLAGS